MRARRGTDGRPVSNHGARIETASNGVGFRLRSCRPVSNHGARIETPLQNPQQRVRTGRPVSNHGARIETLHWLQAQGENCVAP